MFVAEAAGNAAIITAIGGVVVSLLTIYTNSKKQAGATDENSGHISALTGQIADLAQEVAKLQAENAALKAEVKVLRELLHK